MRFKNPTDGRIILTRSDKDEKLPNGRPLFRVTNPFDGKHAVTGGLHLALDLGNFNCGDNVYAMADGTARTMKDGAGALIVIVKHAEGYETVYAHLASFSIAQGVSVPVKAGQLLGKVGSTGVSSACHLHLEVKLNGVKVDPYPLLNQRNLPTFSDVPVTHPFYHAIEWMAAEGLSSGTGLGKFSPDRPVTRGELAAFLHRLDNKN